MNLRLGIGLMTLLASSWAAADPKMLGPEDSSKLYGALIAAGVEPKNLNDAAGVEELFEVRVAAVYCETTPGGRMCGVDDVHADRRVRFNQDVLNGDEVAVDAVIDILKKLGVRRRPIRQGGDADDGFKYVLKKSQELLCHFITADQGAPVCFLATY